MSATSRLEKHKGVTLIVNEGWISVVWDATGHIIEGPVKDDMEVKKVVEIALPTLKKLAGLALTLHTGIQA